MSHLRFDSVGGASGDMILGALVDLGAAPSTIEHAANALGAGVVRIEAEKVRAHGLGGTRVHVHADEPHAHEPYAHGVRVHTHARAHRAWREIRAMIEGAALPAPVREGSLRVFARLAAAEGRIHGCPADDVHFHEAGALDSIADIVGACAALHELGVAGIVVGPLPLGSGTVVCAHGTYPLPAPAVADLLRGHPVEQVAETVELVTPTGAALLMEWKSATGLPSGLTLTGAGCGWGHRTLAGRPNLLRVLRFEPLAVQAEPAECLMLETQVDDSTGEWIGVLAGRLMEAGALDVHTTAVQMKKQRPGVKLTVLCRTADREAMLDLVFRGCSTLGVREQTVRRTVLERRFETVRTPYGDVRVKVGLWRGEAVTRAPEMDDCVARAAEHGVSARAVYEAAVRADPAT